LRLGLGCLLLLGAGSGCAQAEGIQLGKFEFYPSVAVDLARDSNVFNQGSDPLLEGTERDLGNISDTTADLRLPLILRLPFRSSYWQLTYIPGVTRYNDTSDLDGYTHDVSSELNLVFSSGATLLAEGRLLWDYLNTQAFDPGGERVFSDSDYRVSSVRVNYEQPLSLKHGVQVLVLREGLTYEDERLTNFDEFTNLRANLNYVRFLSNEMKLFIGLTGSTNDIDQFQSSLSDECAGFEPDDDFCRDEYTLWREAQEDHWTSTGFQVGLQRQFDDRNSARLDIGYETMESDNSDDSDYSGLVGRMRYQRVFSEALFLSAELLRQPQQSSFDVNNYYVNQRASVSAQFHPAGMLFYAGSLLYYVNDYPDESELTVNDRGDIRKDYNLSGDASLGLQVAGSATLELTFSARRRNSSIDRFDFSEHVVGLSFRYGFSPDREFI
jgi:hypothetical protein